ncbi:MAG: rbn [Planctomycetaceae bacterium]|nr:rbn [Planctomycetaceae bacterium]
MKLQFLGTGGYHPNERRHTACLLLPEIGVVFDAGSAAFRIQSRLQSDELDLFVTHAHLDHVCGLTYFVVPFITGQLKTARVHVKQQYLSGIEKYLFSEPLFPLNPGFVYHELSDPVILRDGGRVSHMPLTHPGGSTGFRIDWPGKSLAYITDTTATPNSNYLEFIRGVDVLIHECYFPDSMAEWSPKSGHSNTTPVAELAREAGVRRLFLVHIDPQHPEEDPIGIATARSIFPATEIAEDLMEIEF